MDLFRDLRFAARLLVKDRWFTLMAIVVLALGLAANNTVFSYNVADASIKYISKGNVTDSQRKGWFTRIWEKLAPF